MMTREKDVGRDARLAREGNYTGGEITFPNFNFTFSPRSGTLLMFPSDCRYLHSVLSVTKGIGHTIVSWCAMEP
ncbi:MAG: hypothetical protein Cons2KO_10520 [Congregibacter sp.]